MKRNKGIFIGAVLLLTASACATGLDGMRSELDMKGYRDVAVSERNRPKEVVLVDTAAAGEPPVRVAVELRGRGDAKHIVAALHGLLSDRLTWRYIANRLQADHDLMLVDLPGCGGSDKPDPDEMGPDAYTTTSMARRVLLALRHCLALRGDEVPVTLLAHSLGGAVVLRMLGDTGLREEFDDVIARIGSVVLLAPMDVGVERQYEVFRQIAEVSDLEVAIGELIGVLQAQVVEATIEGSADRSRAIREEAGRMIAALCDPERRHAAQEMIRRAVPFDENGRPDWEVIQEREADYRNVDVPCLIIWGARDEALPRSMGNKIQSQLPDAWLRVLPLAKHALPTERPWVCASLVRDFIGSRGEGWAACLDLEENGRGDTWRDRTGSLLIGQSLPVPVEAEAAGPVPEDSRDP